MTKHGAWSVKGIDQRAREAAREAAREEGLTIGEYINRMLLEEGEEAAASSFYDRRANHPEQHSERSDYRRASSPRHGAFDDLIERLEAVETRSALALRGIDQSIVGLVSRLNDTDAKSDRVSGDVDRLVADLRTTRDKLQSKVRALEEDQSGSDNLESLKTLEDAVGRLSQRLHDENSRHRDDIGSVRRKVDSGLEELDDRVAGVEDRVDTRLSEAASRISALNEKAELRAEGTARHLSERVTGLESELAEKVSQMNRFQQRMSNVEGEVAGALSSIESVMSRMQDRLHQAESSTNTALEGLEETFRRLDQRIDVIAEHASPEAAAKLRAQFEDRFEGLAGELRSSIENSRADLAREIEQAASEAASPEAMQKLESSVQGLEQRVSASEAKSDRALENMTNQVRRISAALDRRLRKVEASGSEAAVEEMKRQVARVQSELAERLKHADSRNDDVIDKLTAQMKSMADEFDSRIGESEQRSANAIEQVGEQVASVTQRMQARQDRALSDIQESVDTATKQQNKRLSDALSGVSDRLEKMQQQQASSLSPVQKAIASLATRLEALEDFTTPPHADTEPYEAPDFATPAVEHFGDAIGSASAFESEENDALAPADETVEESPDLTESFDEDPWLEDEEEFEAGVPELSELDEEEYEFEETLEFETPEDDVEDDPRHAEYETELMAAPEAELADPLSELSGWDDGSAETRESDIFSDEEPEEDPFFIPSASNDFEADVPEFDEISEEDESEVSDEAAQSDTRDDTEAMDYLSRARRAALAASAENGARNTYDEPSQRKSRIPLVAAVSVIALATAAAGTFVTLRGLQDDADKPVIQSTSAVPSQATPTSAAAPAELAEADVSAEPASLEGVARPPADPVIAPLSPDEMAGLSESDAAAVEEELFESETPETVDEPADAPQGDVVNFAALPEVPQSPTLEAAASGGNPVAQYMLGEQRLNDGDYTDGPSLVRRAAESGQPAAQYRLAKLHERGLGVPKDLEAARQWTERAAEGGNVKAMHDLAVYYAEGEGGAQNYAASVKWFRKAADYGLTDSQYNLALLYESGLGISTSETEALYWYEVARKQGDTGAKAKIDELSGNLSADAVQQAKDRAASWSPTQWPAAANGNFGPQAWQGGGSTEQVMAIQTVLSALGYEPGPQDGIMGAATVDAIEAYQGATGLEATGTITSELVASLNETVARSAGNS